MKLLKTFDLQRLHRIGIDGIEAYNTAVAPEYSASLKQYARVTDCSLPAVLTLRKRMVPGPVCLPKEFVGALRRFALPTGAALRL